jgi:hypothetical protein
MALALAMVATTACRPAKVRVIDFHADERDMLFSLGEIDWRDYEPVAEATVYSLGSRLYLPYLRSYLIPPLLRAGDAEPFFARFNDIARALGGDAFTNISIRKYRPTYAGYPYGRYFVGSVASGSDGWFEMRGTVVRLKDKPGDAPAARANTMGDANGS